MEDGGKRERRRRRVLVSTVRQHKGWQLEIHDREKRTRKRLVFGACTELSVKEAQQGGQRPQKKGKEKGGQEDGFWRQASRPAKSDHNERGNRSFTDGPGEQLKGLEEEERALGGKKD